MFQMTALVCGLTIYPGIDEQGCFYFEHRHEFKTEEECEQVMPTGILTLYQHLLQSGETESELMGYGCKPVGEAA